LQSFNGDAGHGATGFETDRRSRMDRAVGTGHPPYPLLADACGLADAAIETVRRIIADLRPSVLDQLGVWAALDWYAGQIQARTGLPCRLRPSSHP
jgi:two-component system sensor histidine kinase UhpB